MQGKYLFRTALARNVLPFALVNPPLVALPLVKEATSTCVAATLPGKQRWRLLTAAELTARRPEHARCLGNVNAVGRTTQRQREEAEYRTYRAADLSSGADRPACQCEMGSNEAARPAMRQRVLQMCRLSPWLASN